MFEKIKRFYELKLYTQEQVRIFMEKSVITEEEYEKIIKSDSAE